MTKRKSEMTSYLNNGYDVMNYFSKFEKFLPHSISIPSFMTVGSQMPELDPGGFPPPPPYKIGSQNTPYKLGLITQFDFQKHNSISKIHFNFTATVRFIPPSLITKFIFQKIQPIT